MSDLDRKLAEARKPYADKIMTLQAELAEATTQLGTTERYLREQLRQAEAHKEVLMRQVEERNTELAIVRSQRDGLRRAMAVIEQAAHAASNL